MDYHLTTWISYGLAVTLLWFGVVRKQDPVASNVAIRDVVWLDKEEKSHSEQKHDKLEFVHIPKTAGTSIEEMGAKAGIAWGACKFFHCNLPPNTTRPNKAKWECYNKDIVPWHCPPMMFKAGINLYENSTTFAVVRNPYSRITSEYYWKMVKVDHVKLSVANNEDLFNGWINDALDTVFSKGFYFAGHCIPMHVYTHSEGKQIVDHILHLENISVELPALLERYNLNINMPHENARRAGSLLGVKNMTKATISKVNYWAHLDFELFGYDMIDSIQ